MYFLGIDGGGTKTSFLLCDERGKKLGNYTTSTCHYYTIGHSGVTKIMKAGADKLLKGIDRTKVFACVGTTGFGDIQKYDQLIVNAIKKGLGVSTVVYSDTANALAGALGLKDGINIIAGTGSVAVGLKDNNYAKSGGWHHLFLGDEGSAYWLACALIKEFTYQSDGRHEKTILYSYLYNYYNMKNDDDILKLILYDYQEDRAKIAAMAKHLPILAEKNDKYAKEIYHNAVDEYMNLILAVKKQLNFDKVNCSYTGGVFKSIQLFKDEFTQKLQNHNVTLIKPILTPLEGSILLAMKDHLEINAEIINNLKK